MRIYASLLIAWTCSWMMVGCASASSDTSSVSTRTSSSVPSDPVDISQYDFTTEFETQVLIDQRGASEQVNALIGYKAMGAISQHPNDENILGLKLVGADHWWGISQTLMLVTRYVIANGETPPDGAALFPELLTPEGQKDFAEMYYTERITKYGPGVNIATKRFYTSFSDPNWRPGGIYIEILSGSNGTFYHDGNPINFVSEDASWIPTGAYYYKVFSAKQGTVLFEDFVTYKCDGC